MTDRCPRPADAAPLVLLVEGIVPSPRQPQIFSPGRGVTIAGAYGPGEPWAIAWIGGPLNEQRLARIGWLYVDAFSQSYAGDDPEDWTPIVVHAPDVGDRDVLRARLVRKGNRVVDLRATITLLHDDEDSAGLPPPRPEEDR